MNRRAFIGLIAAGIIGFLWGVPVHAAPILKPHFTVHLIVMASHDLKYNADSALTKDLSKLTDVDVTQDTSADWVLYLNIVPIMDASGVKGYILSTLITDQYSSNRLKNLPAEDFKSPQVASTIKALAEGQLRLQDHLVQTCAPTAIPIILQRIVDYFDATYLMPAREDISNFDLRQK